MKPISRVEGTALESLDRFSDLSGIQFLPATNPVDYQREMGLDFFPFEKEKELYSCIVNGDLEKFDKEVSSLRESRVVIGPMASGADRSFQYAEVSFAY